MLLLGLLNKNTDPNDSQSNKLQNASNFTLPLLNKIKENPLSGLETPTKDSEDLKKYMKSDFSSAKEDLSLPVQQTPDLIEKLNLRRSLNTEEPQQQLSESSLFDPKSKKM